jgi:putative transposase
MEQFRRSNHSVSKRVVHLVFVTKYRLKLFDDSAINVLQHLFAMVGAEQNCCLVAADGEADHFHLLVEYPPSLSIADLVPRLKGRASKELRESRPDMAKRFWKKGVLWTPGYFAVSAGGAPLSTIKKYFRKSAGIETTSRFPPRALARGFHRRFDERRTTAPLGH